MPRARHRRVRKRDDEGAAHDLQVQRVKDLEVVARIEAERYAAVDPARPEGEDQDQQQAPEEEPEPERDGDQDPRASRPLFSRSSISGTLHFGEDALVLAGRLSDVLDHLQPFEDLRRRVDARIVEDPPIMGRAASLGEP